MSSPVSTSSKDTGSGFLITDRLFLSGAFPLGYFNTLTISGVMN
jgi:hypothetical protein